MSEIAPGDCVSFTKAVRPAVKQRIRDASGGNHDAEITPERWIDQSGSGLVLKVAKSAKTIDGVKHRTARVDAGPWLKTLTVSLDDAVVIAQQTGMDMDSLLVTQVHGKMYDTAGDGA